MMSPNTSTWLQHPRTPRWMPAVISMSDSLRRAPSVTKIPFTCGSKLSHPRCQHNVLCTHEPSEFPSLLVFLIAQDKAAAGAGVRLLLPLFLCLLPANGPDPAQHGSCQRVLALSDAEYHRFPLV